MRRAGGIRPFLAYLWFAAAVFWAVLAAVDGFQTSLYLIAAGVSVLAGVISVYTGRHRTQGSSIGAGSAKASRRPKKKKK